jgi:transposase InsO family protein
LDKQLSPIGRSVFIHDSFFQAVLHIRLTRSVSESFSPPRKIELGHDQTYQTRVEAAKQTMFEYIEICYNRERLHSVNGYLSPVNYELQHKVA